MVSIGYTGFTDWYNAVRDDIFKFAESLNIEPSPQQNGLLLAVQRGTNDQGPRRIAVKSGQGPGKTRAAAICALWRLLQDENSGGVISAPTMRQLKDAFLVECSLLIEGADKCVQDFFQVTKSRVLVCGKHTWGITLVTATKVENSQGYHRPNLTIIVDESSGVSEPIITQYKGTLSNPNPMLILIGNPNTRTCEFFKCFNDHRHMWECLTWNAEDTSRDRPDILDPRRNQELEEEFGRDSDVYRVRVLGEFPHTDPNCVVSSDDIEKCIGGDAWMLECAGALDRRGVHIKQFGYDFARFGADESTLFRRSGNAIVEWDWFVKTEPAVVIRHGIAMQHAAGWSNRDCLHVADASGLGGGAMSNFYDEGKNVHEFHNGGVPYDSQYANKITEAWFEFAKRVRRRGASLPKDSRLISQLAGRQYYLNKKGKLIVETKEEYMKRGFDSPDRGEGCLMAFYDQVQAMGNFASAAPESHRFVGMRVANKR